MGECPDNWTDRSEEAMAVLKRLAEAKILGQEITDESIKEISSVLSSPILRAFLNKVYIRLDELGVPKWYQGTLMGILGDDVGRMLEEKHGDDVEEKDVYYMIMVEIGNRLGIEEVPERWEKIAIATEESAGPDEEEE